MMSGSFRLCQESFAVLIPAQLQGKDERILLLNFHVIPVAIVQLHDDAVSLFPALECASGTVVSAI